MKLTAEEIAQVRAKFIIERQDALSGLGQALQNRLVDMLVKQFVATFEQSNGNLLFNGANIRATAALDKVFDEFMRNEQVKLIIQFASDISRITDLNIQYYATFTDRQEALKKAGDKVKALMRARLGLQDDNTLYRGGFLDSFVRDTTLRAQAKFLVLQGVTNQIPARALLSDLQNYIMGPAGLDGALVAKYNAYLFDTYQQHDSATSKVLGEALGLKCFIYAGGIIDTSREFCKARNGKCFTSAETETWIDDPTLPRSKEERKTSVVNYDPIIDRGRWRCRHHINYIPDSWAIKLRPELKGTL